jgi:hypothetical protein
MANDVRLNLGAGGDLIAAEEIAGKKYQAVKIYSGLPGVADGPISASNPLPVQTGDVFLKVTNWIDEVASGHVAGSTLWSLRGHTHALGSAEQCLWGATDLPDYDLLNSADTVFVASTSADDDVGGIGALTVRLTGTGDTFVEQTEDIILSGQTPVETLLTWTGVCGVQVLTAGTSRRNTGAIWVGDGVFTGGVPTRKYGMIQHGYGSLPNPCFVIPTGKVAYLYSAHVSGGEDSDQCEFRVRIWDGLVDRVIYDLRVSSSGVERIFTAEVIPEHTLVYLTGYADTGPQHISCHVTLLLTDM